MATICPQCDARGGRVEMNVDSIRCEMRIRQAPTDVYPDGTAARWEKASTATTVCAFRCPTCGFTEEGVNCEERPAAVPSP